MSTEIVKGSEVITRFGWSGVVEAVRGLDENDEMVFVSETDENGRTLNSGWERISTLTNVTDTL